MDDKKGLGEDGFPSSEGVYLIKGEGRDKKNKEVDVYYHPLKGLCCYSEDINRSVSLGCNTYDDTDCHMSVQNTGLIFIKKIKDLR